MIRSILLTIFAFISAFSFSCHAQQPTDSNFNLLFKYDVGAGDQLNTFNNTYTKDMVMDPPITVGLKLTDEEKQKIYGKMIEIDFFNYPDEFAITVPPGQVVGIVTPSPSYYFHVEYDSRKKDLSWNDYILNDDARADKLRELIRLVEDIVESKDEYKRLPPPSGGYE